MSLKDKVSFQEIKGLSSKEISDLLAKNAFNVPKEDMEAFTQFTQAEPGSEERLTILSDRQEAPPGVVPGSEQDVKPEKEPATEPEVNFADIDPDDPTAAKAPDKSKAPDAKKPKGDIEEEIIEAEGVVDITKYAEVIQERDGHRSANSKLGNENRDLKARIEEMERLHKEQNKEPEIVPLEAPIPPSPEEFEEGLLSAEYTEAQTKYARDYKEYAEKSGSVPPAWAKTLMDKVEKVEAKTEKAFTFAQTEQQTQEDTAYDNAMNGMWNNTIELQKKLNLPTGKLTPKQLNYYVLREGNPLDKDGNPKYSAAEVEGAKNFMKEVPKDTKANFNKLSSVVNSYYHFSEKGPEKASNVADEFLLPDIIQKLGIKVNTVVPVPNSNPTVDDLSKQQTNVSDVSAAPATGLGDPKDTLSNNMGFEEKREMYDKMTQTFLKSPHACKANTAWMKTFDALEKEMQQQLK